MDADYVNATPQPSREELVDKYFNQLPVKPSYAGPLIGLIGGGVLILLGLASIVGASQGSSGGNTGFGCLGCLGLLGGLGAAIPSATNLLSRYTTYTAAMKLAFPRASDEWMEQWLRQGMELAADNGRRRLNRHAEEVSFKWGVDMLVFTGLPPDSVFPIRMTKGRDGVLRASHYKILVAYLSHYRLSTYECVLEMRSGMTLTDGTKEYHLQSVDGLETFSDRVNFALQPGMAAQPQNAPHLLDSTGKVIHVTMLQVLRLMVAGRPAISLVMGIASADQLHVDGVSNSQTESMIHSLREYLRSHNGAMTGMPMTFLPNQLPPNIPPQPRIGE